MVFMLLENLFKIIGSELNIYIQYIK